MRISRFAPILALSVAYAADVESASGPSEVLDLTAADFKDKVHPEPLILVEFFAPWCGHCKALAPHYDEASIALKEKGIPIAKVDCVDQADLCQEHGIGGYPTLKVFKNGTASDYNGPRKADGIISYMIKQSLPAVTLVTQANFEEFKKSDKMVLIAHVDSESHPLVAEFNAAAEEHRDDYLFGLSTDSKVLELTGSKTHSLVLYRSFDEPELTHSVPLADVTRKEIVDFLKENSVPLLDEVSQDNYALYAQSGLPLAYLFIDPEDADREKHITNVKTVAQTHKGKINFVTIDAVKFVDHAKALNVDTSSFPAFVIQDLSKQLKFPHDSEQGLSAKALGEFTQKFVDGKLEPILKSEPIPESQDGPVTILVGKSFDDIVFDESKDVFVEFYAPWCGHCKRLAPIWDSLGERYSDDKDKLVIAKMDATENDLPPSVPFRVSGFPTLKFKPAGSRDFKDYEGDRSLESLIEFVEAQVKNPLKPKSPASSPKVEDAQKPMGDGHDEL